ncbi:MAG: alpha-L-fucosidase C-terminal domain-containing protein [Bryobacteraceae bacterium]
MDVNGEAIHGTRPWMVYGEGPTRNGGSHFKERIAPFTPADVRFTSKGNRLYAIVLGWPAEDVKIKSLGVSANLLEKKISYVRMLGSEERLRWSHRHDFLAIALPRQRPCAHAVAFEVS